MKIALITDCIRDNSTGIGFYTKDVAKELIKNDKKNEYIFVDYQVNNFNKDKLFKINNPFKIFKTYLWHNWIPFKTRNFNVDLIINFTSVPHFLPFKQKEIFFVYDISWYLYPEYHPKSRVLFYKAFFKTCIDNSIKIVADSQSAKEDLIKYFSISKNKISVIYPSIPRIIKEGVQPKVNIDTPYILYIGTLEPRKNIVSILRAFKKLKDKKQINHKLIICGKKGWMFDEIFKLISTLKIEPYVKYMGYVTDEEKKYLFKNAEMFIFPSNYEGFGIPVIEAISYGCPVITSNKSSLPEAVGKAGIQVDPSSVDDLVDAMSDLIFNKRIKENIINNQPNQLIKINNKKQIAALIDYINKINE
jgi:glycosyltransferase involved in cell wall biosynthesis